MIKSEEKLHGQYGVKHLAIDEAIDRGASLGLVQESTSMEITMHICALDLKFPSDYSILSHPNVLMGNTGASVTTAKNNMGIKSVQKASTTKLV